MFPRFAPCLSGTLIAAAVLLAAPAFSAATFEVTTFAKGGDAKASGPDSIEVGKDSVWVAYENGSKGDGSAGSSVVVQYALTGAVQQSFTIPGSVDTLRINPADGVVWATQNQDGNSTLTLINPATGIVAGSPFAFAVTEPKRGYDDIVFKGGKVFMTHTNSKDDPKADMIQIITSGNGPMTATPVLMNMAKATDLVTGTEGVLPAKDPDSLIAAPNGDLVLSSADDGLVVFVHNPAAADQAVSYLTLTGCSQPACGFDDVAYATAANGTFYMADENNNRVVAVKATGLTVGALFAAMSDSDSLAEVDMKTGAVTAVVGADAKLSSPKGLAFLANP